MNNVETEETDLRRRGYPERFWPNGGIEARRASQGVCVDECFVLRPRRNDHDERCCRTRRGGNRRGVIVAARGNARDDVPAGRAKARPTTAWLAAAKYGVFIHFLGGGPKWSARVDAFDVEGFAAEMEQAGAAYVFITLGQNTGYYCAEQGLREVRRVPAERAVFPAGLAPGPGQGELSKRKIRLLLYLPSRSPQKDPQAMAGLSEHGPDETCPPGVHSQMVGSHPGVVRAVWRQRVRMVV